MSTLTSGTLAACVLLVVVAALVKANLRGRRIESRDWTLMVVGATAVVVGSTMVLIGAWRGEF